MPANEVLKV